MSQSLLIGLGGTGSRVVNNVVKLLRQHGKSFNDGQICCAVLDTNVNDNESIKNSNTGIPVIATSKPIRIRQYLTDYMYKGIDEWCPQSPSFLEETMLDGAGELRTKSRIAFMDSMETGTIARLENLINDVLLNNDDKSKIRIMIVSSLCGGTGSGMFIQVALWLRKLLYRSEITIRGIFLLPDIFVENVKDVKNNKMTQQRHYSNAYAAIREVNAITKVLRGLKVDLRGDIAIGNLFDSKKDKDTGKPVFDYAFFIDNKDENGASLKGMEAYEKMAAQLVYMQLYSPMVDDMHSEEDNTYDAFNNVATEPLYAACGTSKALYPADSVREYCVLRLAMDSLSNGWGRLDNEINAHRKELEREKKRGENLSETIDVRAEYIKLFDEEASKKAEEAGADRFFLSIARDIYDEEKRRVGEKVEILYHDKVQMFMETLNAQRIRTSVTRNSRANLLALTEEEFVATKHSRDQLERQVTDDSSQFEDELKAFEKNAGKYADQIVKSVFPLSMGDVNPKTEGTIYGLLTKDVDAQNRAFIHPVAARYVLYKLVDRLTKEKQNIVLEASKQDAYSGGLGNGGASNLFDNKATDVTETEPIEFLNSKRWYQKEDAHLDDFETRYVQFIETRINLCEKYETELLQQKVYQKLIARINELIAKLEMFFNDLDEVQKKYKKDLSNNVKATNGTVDKTIYVYGDAKAKEEVYQSLYFDVNSDTDNRVNKAILNAVYGSLCAEKLDNEFNAPYAKIDIISAFITETIKTYGEMLDNQNNAKKIYLNIIEALHRQSDREFNEAKEKSAKSNRPGADQDEQKVGSIDYSSGAVSSEDAAEERRRSEIKECLDRLLRLAAPYLDYDSEVPRRSGTIQRQKTFWGFHPEVSDASEEIRVELGVNASLQADTAYEVNALYCYRAEYGLKAEDIPKFKEIDEEGTYYSHYRLLVDDMSQSSLTMGSRALVRTPHLDKNWHRILPFISDKKQRQEAQAFFRGFWLAIAYDRIRVKGDEINLTRKIDSGFGERDKDTPIMYNERSVTKTQIKNLVEALRADPLFVEKDIPELEEKFAEELEAMTGTYLSLPAYKGLTSSRSELDPVSVVVRYSESRGKDPAITDAMIDALEAIASMMAQKQEDLDEEKLEELTFKICHKFYTKTRIAKDKLKDFARWQ